MEVNSRVCLEDEVNWVKERKTFSRRLVDQQAILHKFTQIKKRINATQGHIQTCSQQFIKNKPNTADIALLQAQTGEIMECCVK